MASNPRPLGHVDALGIIEEEARAVAQMFSVDPCDVMAQMLVRRIATRLGGQKVHVSAKVVRERRDTEMRRRFHREGVSYATLALETDLDERQVRRIVHRKD